MDFWRKCCVHKHAYDLFERSAKTQYTRELLFSTVVNLMSLVVCGIHPSIHAAHQALLRGNRSFGHIDLQQNQWYRTELGLAPPQISVSASRVLVGEGSPVLSWFHPTLYSSARSTPIQLGNSGD
ncbi:MAG: hypothetical protein KME30_20090 [Iphinoe sp. HA4291-MV1]|nr:hypothetical protein [Iphinoe sp. HA4291-MV1]